MALHHVPIPVAPTTLPYKNPFQINSKNSEYAELSIMVRGVGFGPEFTGTYKRVSEQLLGLTKVPSNALDSLAQSSIPDYKKKVEAIRNSANSTIPLGNHWQRTSKMVREVDAN